MYHIYKAFFVGTYFSGIPPVVNLKCFCLRIEPTPTHKHQVSLFFVYSRNFPCNGPLSFVKISYFLLTVLIKNKTFALFPLKLKLLPHSLVLFIAMINAYVNMFASSFPILTFTTLPITSESSPVKLFSCQGHQKFPCCVFHDLFCLHLH